ncbi:4'-phosphopantetheinyl transferase superfamily protein [Paenibacillus polymyxa]|uniref:4'-phosphopantetheinyl transferase family protein n=2 Tax=Paenibacillus polymyxa TaxID=1406 RepID=UPI0004D821EF|nr:4'-phosphopantetheinyl transferase superfamily protein [Paenibacillus polymyxa]KEO78089.1 4-phosphopantetheinyl transferase [Paenibacillus polymyxa]MCH6188632.1 4'-phosphopantetheinyl transferase superfamily protein [Paenibacillus polymyxa]
MVVMYRININESIKNNNIKNLMQFISSSRRKRAMRFWNVRDSYRSVLGEMLARYAICHRSGCLNENIKMQFDAGSKPRLLFPAGLFFNISHSGDWVLCAISNNSVGIDVEYMKEVNLQIAECFFSTSEYQFILNHHSEEELKKRFYQIWTLKESYVKADGRGLRLPMKSFSMLFKEQHISIHTENALRNCKFKTFQIDEQYIVSVCSVQNPIGDSMEELNIQDVVSLLQST